MLKFKVTQNVYIISEMVFTETILGLEFTSESDVHDLHCNFISELSWRVLPPDLSLTSEVSRNRLRKNCVRAETGHDGWCLFELGEVYSLI